MIRLLDGTFSGHGTDGHEDHAARWKMLTLKRKSYYEKRPEGNKLK